MDLFGSKIMWKVLGYLQIDTYSVEIHDLDLVLY